MNNKKFVEKLEKYLKRQFGVTISNASKRQVYEALMSTVRDDLSEKKFSYEQELKKTKQKRAYYMSMEFLVGRTLRNNLLWQKETSYISVQSVVTSLKYW